jgi:hypothetical protein
MTRRLRPDPDPDPDPDSIVTWDFRTLSSSGRSPGTA